MSSVRAAVVPYLHAALQVMLAIALALQRFTVAFPTRVVLAVAHDSAIVFMEDAFVVINSHGRSVLV